MRSEPTIRSATARDEDDVLATLTLAFVSDPGVRRNLYPAARDHLAHFGAFVRALGGKAFAAGTADYVEGGAAAALWLAPGVLPDEEALVTLIRETRVAERIPEVFQIVEQMASFHPTEPHWYLPFIGVDPPQQRQGHGAGLMRHALRRCDRDHAIAYLESSNEANLPFYEAHGFALLGTVRIGAQAPMFPMLRQAR